MPFHLIAALFVLAAAFISATNAADDPPQPKEFCVHEWGVYTVSPNERFANADRKAQWSQLPKEVCGLIPGRELPQPEFIDINKPLLYFYATKTTNYFAEQVNVKVTAEFKSGSATVWWPAADSPFLVGSGNLLGDVTYSLVGNPDKLEWCLSFDDNWNLGLFNRTIEPMVACPDFTWKREALLPDSDTYCLGGGKRAKFLFYEGLVPNLNGVALKSKPDDKGNHYFIANAAKFDALDVFVIERTKIGTSLAFIEKLPGQTEGKVATEQEVKLELIQGAAAWNAQTQVALKKCLLKAGLFDAEAEGLVKIWDSDFFQTPGTHVLYRLPQEEYDKRVVLTVDPKPAQCKRVALVWMPHLEPEFEAAITALVKSLGSEDIDERNAAMEKLHDFTPSPVPVLKGLLEKERDRDVRIRLATLIRQLSVDPDALKQRWDHLEPNATTPDEK